MSAVPLSSVAARPTRAYRILHLTDIHFTLRPTLRECWAEPKRFLGLLNHTLLGRSGHFSLSVQQQLASEVQRHAPTHLVISGDLTSFASEREFELAHDSLRPILQPAAQPYPPLGSSSTLARHAFSSTTRHPGEHTLPSTTAAELRTPAPANQPSTASTPSASSEPLSAASSPSYRTLLLSGNHDVYTPSSVRARLFDRWFGHWRLPTARLLSVAPDLHFVAIDACQPNAIGSHGHVDQQQLSLLRSTLSSSALRSSFVVLVSHYPLVDRGGGDYSAGHSWHGIDNNSQVSAAVREALAPLLAPQQPTQHTVGSHYSSEPAHSTPTSSPSHLFSVASTPPPPASSVSPSTAGSAALLLHGHVHRGYSVPFPLSAAPRHSFPVYNPGSAGLSFEPGKRAAAYNLYHVSRDEEGGEGAEQSEEEKGSGCRVHRMNGWRLAVERFVHNGQTFEREPQGPYSSAY